MIRCPGGLQPLGLASNLMHHRLARPVLRSGLHVPTMMS
jgi:hypothetical protein